MRKTNGFTLIELLTVVVILGVIMTLAIPAVRNLTYNNSQKKYSYHEKLVHEAAKLYVKNYRGELKNNDSECFNVPYQTLLSEGLVEEEGITCSGSVVLRKRTVEGYNYEYYLNCYDEEGKPVHESDPIPLSCKGMGGNFKVDYALYKDGPTGQENYREGEWTKYVYGEYNSSSPYNLPVVSYQYSYDMVNWDDILNQKQTYTNQNGNIFIKATDSGTNPSEITRHLVRADSKGPEFALTGNELDITANNTMVVNISNIFDEGVGVDTAGNSYSYDQGKTWVNQMSKEFAFDTTTQVSVRDRLGNISADTVNVIKGCSSTNAVTAGAGDILSGKTVWVNGRKITGTMPNNGAKTATLNAGGSYTIPAGFHNGSGKITAKDLASQTVGNAVANDILVGKTAWVNGVKITGTNKGYDQGYTEGLEAGKSQGNFSIVTLETIGTGPSAKTRSYDLNALGYDTTNVTNSNFFATMRITVSDNSATGRETLNVSHTYSNGVVTFNINGSHNGDNTSLSATIDLMFIKTN